jgi:hypothetical protein
MKDGKMSRAEAGRIGWEKAKEKHEARNRLFRERYDALGKRCLTCNKLIPYEKRKLRFCNHSCAAISNNKGVRKWGKEPSLCEVCGKRTTSSARRFCSVVCFHMHNRKKAFERIDKDGTVNIRPDSLGEIDKSGKIPSADNRVLARRYLLSRRGHVCEICKNTEWMGKPIPLLVDHVDGNSDNGSVANLRLVCGNCDMQLPTYKGRNRGHGRHYRRERYANGQSW